MECSGRRNLVERRRKEEGIWVTEAVDEDNSLLSPGDFSQGVSVMISGMVHKECGVQDAHLGVSLDSGVAADLRE